MQALSFKVGRGEVHFLAASLKLLISNFLALAISLNLLMTTLFKNQNAARVESGMEWLPWIWILRVEWCK